MILGVFVIANNGSTKPIEAVKEGEMVLAKNEQTGEVEPKKVEQKSVRVVDTTLLLTFSNGQKIETTNEHPFYVESQGFVKAGELGIGTSIVTRAGPSTQLVAREVKDKPQAVYNLTVADHHTYFVLQHQDISLDEALWVHNAFCTSNEGLPSATKKDGTPNRSYNSQKAAHDYEDVLPGRKHILDQNGNRIGTEVPALDMPNGLKRKFDGRDGNTLIDRKLNTSGNTKGQMETWGELLDDPSNASVSIRVECPDAQIGRMNGRLAAADLSSNARSRITIEGVNP